MSSLDEAEEPGETAAIISTHQFQLPQILHFTSNINSGNASFQPRLFRNNRRSTSGTNSRERLLFAKRRRSYLKSGSQQPRMSTAGLTVSLFILAALCAAHLLRTTVDVKFNKSYITPDIQLSEHGSLHSNIQPHYQFTSQQRFNFDIERKVSQNINDRFRRFTERLEEYIPSTVTSASLNDWTVFGYLGERQELQVNVLLAERRRRTVQRQRSPTPIPHPVSVPRFISRQRNTSSAPPDSLRIWTHLSTSPTSTQPSTSDFETNFNQSNEPTLMDYDAIDSYWRWDIDQEKGMEILPHQNLNDFGHSQQNYYLNNDRNSEPTDFLFERDIQLLTEKSLLPDQTNFVQDNLNENGANLLANFSRTLSFDGIIENQNENTKWNDLLELPTSSLFVSSGQDRKSSIISQSSFSSNSFQNPQIDETELSNIPISSPCFETENCQNLNRNDFILNERELECSSSSSRGTISPLSDNRQPILFNDVSLARCSSSIASISIGEISDNEEMIMERQQIFGGKNKFFL
uniref:Uncharacterized protein n=1 Tax=Meloidogyne hapla TaxID=6305 RepID=A0A1I8B9B6_MELHA